METLNEYLKSLLSSCSDELRLEPDKNPYLVSANRTTDVGNVPLKGTQISTMVFPLIPPEVRSVLPNKPEVEFVHPHNLGNFTFSVQKSPSGFVVTIRPLLNGSGASHSLPQTAPAIPVNTGADTAPAISAPAVPIQTPQPAEEFQLEQETADQPSYEIESSSAAYDLTSGESAGTSTLSDLLLDDRAPAQEYVPMTNDEPEIEIVSVNDPEFQTVFSDNSTYEPPGRRDDFNMGEYASPTPEVSAFDQTLMLPTPIETPPPAPVVHATAAYEPMSQPPLVQPPAAVQPPPQPSQAAFVAAPANAVERAKMDEFFHKMAEMGSSDLHLSVSMPPMIRQDGKMRPLEDGVEFLTPDAMRALLTSIMPSRNQEEFASRSDTDFAYEIPGLARFRCNVFMDRKGMGAVFRIIPSKMTTASQIGLSDAILGLCGLSKGLVVVTGPTGSGKSTTLCAMVNEINMTREEHIITIEDPIEFVHENIKCLVNQREVHNHTDSFKDALRAALREDPDIVLVGEMRDLETISIAIETAETGHLVFGTLHTTTAASTVDRIIDQFPADRQQQIRVMLSESLKGVIAQTLLPKIGGGRVAALEVLIVTPAISNLIREGKTFQIPSSMQTGKNHGMVMLNDALFEHVQNGTVEPRDAYVKAVDKTGFETQLTRGGFKI
jgi:twitching motility protein PilT